MYWQFVFKGMHYRSATRVRLDWSLWVGQNQTRVVNRQYYGHIEDGAYSFHGKWGLFASGNWGYYSYPCYFLTCSNHLNPSDPIAMCFCGTRLEWANGKVEKDFKFSVGWRLNSGKRTDTWRGAGRRYPKV
jgi:hypothetical protein